MDDEDRIFNPLASTKKDSIRPDFSNEKNNSTDTTTIDDRRNAAAKELDSSEKEAEEAGMKKVDAGVLESKKNEEEAGGLYSGSGNNKTKNGSKKLIGRRIIKFGPVTSIVFGVFLLGGFMFGSQSFQLFAWVSNINIKFGQSSAVLNMRTNFVLRRMLNANNDLTRRDIFGRDKYRISDALKQRLKANNIEVVDTDTDDGKPLRMLVWTDPADGSRIPIVANDADTFRIPASYGEADIPLKKGMTLDTARATLKGFSTDIDTSTIHLTGRMAGWFDSLANMFLRRIGGDDVRNKLRNLNSDSDSEEIDNVMYKNASEGSDDSDTSKVTTKQDDGDSENGETIRAATDSDFATDGNGGNDSLKPGETDVPKIEASLTTRVKKAMVGGSLACMVLRGIGAINAVVAGAQVANIVSNALKIYEASDKVRAGDGNESFHKIANSLNTPIKTTAYDVDGKPFDLEGSTTGSDGWNNAFSDKNLVSENDPGALMVNRENATRVALRNIVVPDNEEFIASWGTLLGQMGSSTAAFGACNIIQIGMGVADFIGDVLLFFSTAGIGAAVKEFFEGIYDAAKTGVIFAALGAAISLLAPKVGQWLAGNVKNVLLGKIGGYALDSGSKIVHDGNLRMSAGMNATKEQALELYAKSLDVKREWAAYDRATLSPFDITSRNTFFGSLAYSFIPLINSSRKSIISSIPSSFNLLGNSITKLSGDSVSALNDVSDFGLSLSSEENCPSLTGMGLAGDAYCNVYSGAYIDDLTTKSSVEIYEDVVENYPNCFDGVDSDGNPRIRPNSDCAKYVIACNTNDTQPGTMSAVVQGYIQKAEDFVSGGTVLGGALVGFASNFIPGEGLLDAIDAKEQLDNAKWNDQSVCSDPDFAPISNYFLDQRVLEGLGVIKESSVAAFLNDYYEENPLDNSYEGVIARYSGLTKEEVTDTIALINYVDYVANYDAGERYAFGEKQIERHYNFEIESDFDIPLIAILYGDIRYADVRNRTITV